MQERTNVLVISDMVDFITIKQTETTPLQTKKSICMIKGKSTGTGFFCCTNYENKNIPCLITNY